MIRNTFPREKRELKSNVFTAKGKEKVEEVKPEKVIKKKEESLIDKIKKVFKGKK